MALISLGEPRPFKLRPTGGGPSVQYVPGRGDLLVMGGSCQRTWDHARASVFSQGVIFFSSYHASTRLSAGLQVEPVHRRAAADQPGDRHPVVQVVRFPPDQVDGAVAGEPASGAWCPPSPRHAARSAARRPQARSRPLLLAHKRSHDQRRCRRLGFAPVPERQVVELMRRRVRDEEVVSGFRSDTLTSGGRP